MLYREPKLLKALDLIEIVGLYEVSVLYREPKLLKADNERRPPRRFASFSALP